MPHRADLRTPTIKLTMPLPLINPPLINSANPWCSTREDLQALFDSPHTGAVTTRTSLLVGFPHDPAIHQFVFFGNGSHSAQSKDSRDGPIPASHEGSLNTLGYSPTPLADYLAMLGDIVASSTLPDPTRWSKPFIISVTGSADDVVECYSMIQDVQETLSNPLCMEVNLSCPNIPSKPPPAYSKSSLVEYLQKLAQVPHATGKHRVAIGLKTPPYTYHDQLRNLIDALGASSTSTCRVDFITAINTLGGSLLLDSDLTPVLNSASDSGIGGMGGGPVHPLALGNVKTIRQLLDEHGLGSTSIIGVGGVSDAGGFRRMKSAGASIVGVGTALGREGVPVFRRIMEGLE